MEARTQNAARILTTIGVDIGKDVFHIVGFDARREDCATRRDFGAWLGLVPRQYSTGGKSILGRMSKRGSRYLRTLFIQAANIILMRPHNWEKYSFAPG